MDINKLDKKKAEIAVNTIKMLAVDAVEAANSGHPGMPMGCADIAFVLWNSFLRFNPKDPEWPNRDRFVLSAGHGSALQYSLLHLYGYDLPIEEVKNFRQLDSLTPGHPEFGHTVGVETTTGPLGQGFAGSVGIAVSLKVMANRFNKYGELFNSKVYGIAGDGDMMEGLSSEAASLAGHLGLSNLIFFYDSNRITIEGATDLAFSEDVAARFRAYNWNVIEIDGHNHKQIFNALTAAGNEKDRPTLIKATTHIGNGSPNRHDTPKAHGEPLGADELKLTKQALGWPTDKPFHRPDDALKIFKERVAEQAAGYDKWQSLFDGLQSSPGFKTDWSSCFERPVPKNLEQLLLKTISKSSIATRAASGAMMQVIADEIPSFIGGSADLSPSNKTFLNSYGAIGTAINNTASNIVKGESSNKNENRFSGRNFHFGIREHAMGAILNGMANSNCCIPFGSTFLVFSDYMRPSIRLAALMKLQVIYIFTHDSIFVGEDGPTHQPVEHVSALRLIPNLTVIRPSEATECASAWIAALNNTTGPTAIILTRQNLPVIDRTAYPAASGLEKGAYTLVKGSDLTILASGSEVSLAMDTAAKLKKENISAGVVSFASFELFEKQSDEYKNSVVPGYHEKIVAIEAGVTDLWYKYVGRAGLVIGIDSFGASGPADKVARLFGLTADSVSEKIKNWL